MNPFQILWSGGKAAVQQTDNTHFTVHLPERILYLEVRQDNEGANVWFEQGTDNADETVKELGLSIETAIGA
jgi:hypothetical protein